MVYLYSTIFHYVWYKPTSNTEYRWVAVSIEAFRLRSSDRKEGESYAMRTTADRYGFCYVTAICSKSFEPRIQLQWRSRCWQGNGLSLRVALLTYAFIQHTFFCKQELASKNFMNNVHKINCMYFILFQLRVNISDIFPPCSFSEINIYLCITIISSYKINFLNAEAFWMQNSLSVFFICKTPRFKYVKLRVWGSISVLHLREEGRNCFWMKFLEKYLDLRDGKHISTTAIGYVAEVGG